MRSTYVSYFKTLLVFVAWLACIITIYIGYDHDNIYNYLIHRALIVTASIITIVVIFKNYKQYKLEQNRKAFIPTITAGICIVVLLSMIWWLYEQDNTRIFFNAKDSRKFSYVSIDLRENNTFKITSKRLFSTDYTRGHFFFRDGILTLTGMDAKKVLASNKFVIRTVYNDSIKRVTRSERWEHFLGPPEIDTTSQTMLIPINAQGAIIDSARPFWITWHPVID